MGQSLEAKKELILKKLKKHGCRITKQRLELLDIILENECSSCKEIYYKALETNPGLGAATVYRMVNILEEIGAIDRKNMYKVADSQKEGERNGCIVVFKDRTTRYLSENKFNQVVQAGLQASGELEGQGVACIVMKGTTRPK